MMQIDWNSLMLMLKMGQVLVIQQDGAVGAPVWPCWPTGATQKSLSELESKLWVGS